MTDFCKTPAQIAKDLNKTIKPALAYFKPPENLLVDQWADEYRVLSPETSAEAGPWRTERTPYLREPMRAFNDPKVHRITMVAGSQVGKTELELNIMGYVMDQIPGTIMYVHPNLGVAKKFSRERIKPMLRDCKKLNKKVHNTKAKEGSNTILQKTYPGGILTICGSETASDLCSTPARIALGDERDRWPKSAGDEGDPWELLLSRQITFYNHKAVEVSTPTIKGESAIEASFMEGTQERWYHQCPHCGEYVNITFNHIKFDFTSKIVNKKEIYNIHFIAFACPHCGVMSSEDEMRKQPAKWIAENPDAYEKGHRSFWLNAFSSPWLTWRKIIERFLSSRKDPAKLKVVYNTLFGELWEDRGDMADEDEMLKRREEYDSEFLPDGVLALTCGVDTQDDRLEYEIVGFGLYGETWGIKKGYIMGRPDTPEVWKRLDDAINHVYYRKNGKGLKVTITCVDSGGHFTHEVYEQCRLRQNQRVFPIKGKGGENIPFVGKPNKVFIKGNKKKFVWLYSIGVDAGKTIIMDNLRVQEPGAKFCHFPSNEERNYDLNYFNGLLSEKLSLIKTKSGKRWAWEKLPGHRSNEALDCRNYALAAFRIWDPDLEAMREYLLEPINKKPKVVHKKATRRVTKSRLLDGGDW
ncbi:MAG: phage terminase large subunit family protein [Cyanobacteria bacterium SIG32]|nr:phage terminase large subunit family protein [Cyanobacteria bacterium SIG32]